MANIRVILDKLSRHPLLKRLSLDAVIDYTVEFMEKTRVLKDLQEKETNLEVNNYIVQLPCDFFKIKSIHYNNYEMLPSTSIRIKDKNVIPTYKVVNRKLQTSIEEGNVTLEYYAIATDKDDLPVIPENSFFQKALYSYIKKEEFSILYDLGEIKRDIYEDACQKYAWEVGQYQSSQHELNDGTMQNIANIQGTVIPDKYNFHKGYGNINRSQKLVIHNT